MYEYKNKEYSYFPPKIIDIIPHLYFNNIINPLFIF